MDLQSIREKRWGLPIPIVEYNTDYKSVTRSKLLAFIFLKMELHWRSNPVGKVNANLPFFRKLIEKEFTQKV